MAEMINMFFIEGYVVNKFNKKYTVVGLILRKIHVGSEHPHPHPSPGRGNHRFSIIRFVELLFSGCAFCLCESHPSVFGGHPLHPGEGNTLFSTAQGTAK